MVSAATVKSLSERLAKAEQLITDGAVFPVAGCPGYAVVRNGDGDSMYLVRIDAGHENCTCPDYKNRQRAAGLPCKHIMAAELALGIAPESVPVMMVDAAKIATARALGIMAPATPAA